MDLPTIARALGRVEEAQARQDEKLADILKAIANKNTRLDRVEKWQSRATGSLTAWAIVWAAIFGWMKHLGK